MAAVARWMRGAVSGKGPLFEWKGMGGRHVTQHIQFEDYQNVAHHEKFNAYGETHFILSNIKKSFGNNYGEGGINLVRHIAEHFPAVVGGKRVVSAGIY